MGFSSTRLRKCLSNIQYYGKNKQVMGGQSTELVANRTKNHSTNWARLQK